MLNENAKSWIAALRGDQYSQAEGKLREYDSSGTIVEGYCCLGVACDLAERAGVEFEWPEDERTSTLPIPVARWLGLDSSFPQVSNMGWRMKCGLGEYQNPSLSLLNDCGYSFRDIADILESNPPGLFFDPDEPLPSTPTAEK